jgi:mannose-1-phosphate guanylyltransferase/phosphomannomutase
MKAVIMAGGFGTRLRPLTYNLPKPMVPVFNLPMMEHIILLLKKYNIKDIITLLYFQSHFITDYFGDGSNWDVKIRYVRAEADFGTAGSVKNAEKYLDERVIIISGDVLTDFNLGKIVDFHNEKNAEATIALTHHPNPLQFGVVLTDETGEISRFLEKPSWGQVFSDTINTGIYILEPQVLTRIPPKEEFDFSQNLFPAMLRAGAPLYGYVSEGYWRDIGNLNEFLTANFDALNGTVNLESKGYHRNNGNWIHETAKISNTAQLRSAVIVGPNSLIGENVVLNNSVIGSDCIIEKDARIIDSILWNGVQIGSSTKLNKNVIGFRSKIGKEVHIFENSFISDDVLIGENVTVKANIKIWPNKQVEKGATVTSSMILGDHWLRELFTDSKISGLANKEITPEFATKIGAALGAKLGVGNSVLVARDSSTAARMVNRGIITGLMSTGINVMDLRDVPTPLIRHQMRTQPATAGLLGRVSPKRPDYVDILFLDEDGSDLPVEKCKSVERLFFGEDFFRAPIDSIGGVEFPSRIIDQYQTNFLNSLYKEVIPPKKYKIVIDFSFGGASLVLPSIMGRLGVNMVALNAFLEGHRLEREPDVIQRSIGELQKIVPTIGADLGFILNASSEKLVVIDRQGRVVGPRKLALCVTKLALETYGFKKMAATVDSSYHLEKICKNFGCELLYTRADHKGMMDAILKQNAEFVVGTKGGFIFHDFHFASDGMYSIARILEMISRSDKQFLNHLEELPTIYIREVTVPCPWNRKGQAMRNIMKHTEGKKRILIDGIRLIEDENCLLFLPDKEKALFHIQVEARTKDMADWLLKKYIGMMKNWIN